MEDSKIGWTKHTFNPWMGCTKVSPACDNCYAERDMDHRFGRVTWGAGEFRVRTSEKNWNKPRAWDRQAAATGEKIKVFCASLADVFDGEKTSDLEAWRKDLFKLIEETPNLYWLLLTKRPQNIMRMVPSSWRLQFPDNVWIGASAENQDMLNLRAPIIAKIPAKVRFLSCEPLLSPLDLGPWLGDHDCHNCNARFWGDDLRADHMVSVDYYDTGSETDAKEKCPSCGYENVEEDGTIGEVAYDSLPATINWIIAGGESGPGWREMDMDWCRNIRDQCEAAGVPFFLKQTSGNRPIKEPELDGRQWMECPEERFATVA